MKRIDLLFYLQVISATQLYSPSSVSESRTLAHLSGLTEHLQATTQFTPAATIDAFLQCGHRGSRITNTNDQAQRVLRVYSMLCVLCVNRAYVCRLAFTYVRRKCYRPHISITINGSLCSVSMRLFAYVRPLPSMCERLAGGVRSETAYLRGGVCNSSC